MWPRRTSKYNAKPVVDGGLRFDSTSEFRRWCDLRLLEKAGEIRNLKHHPVFPLEVNGFLICKLEADANYEERNPSVLTTWLPVVEDTKGGAATQTDVFKLKAKLLLACHGIHIRLVGKAIPTTARLAVAAAGRVG